MRTVISEVFIILIVIAIAITGAVFVKDSIAAGIEELGTVLEERKLNKRIMSKLNSAESDDLRSIAMDILLFDVRALQDWLETKSILPDAQRIPQLEECRQTLAKQRDHYSSILQPMSDKEVLRLIIEQISDRDSTWRRGLLTRLGA